MSYGKSPRILLNYYAKTLTGKTWLDDSISPYELYLKMLYEYFKEELCNTDDEDDYICQKGSRNWNFSGTPYRLLRACLISF